MRHVKDGVLYVVEHGPQGHSRELGKYAEGANTVAGMAMLDWHVERLQPDERVTYERVLEARPQLDVYALIGICGYIRGGASWGTVCKLAGIKEGQIDMEG